MTADVGNSNRTGARSMPRRVQVRGDYFHGELPAGAVYIGRQAPGFSRSKWANPFKAGQVTPVNWPAPFANIRVRDAVHAVALFRQLAHGSPAYQEGVRAELRGRDLACWCKPNAVCHGDVLIELANGGESDG